MYGIVKNRPTQSTKYKYRNLRSLMGWEHLLPVASSFLYQQRYKKTELSARPQEWLTKVVAANKRIASLRDA